ncbi:MAG TPA: hypothetical protein VGV86_07370 [Acidimicrobiales bacterium]|nr:hypothetical protein [Acidimicrobiales bacterium]
MGAIVFVVLVTAAVVVYRPAEPETDAVAAGAWRVLPAGGLTGRSEPSVVWTRKSMIIWGGEADAGVRGDGASFDLPSEKWTPLPAAPIAPRRSHSAVWTGTKMLVYGGTGISAPCVQICALGDGAAYDAITGAWTALAPAPLAPRSGHRAVWLQNRMVVWGGAGEGGAALADGASYDPVSDSWVALPPSPLEARAGHGAVATTHRLLVWGGSSEVGGRNLTDGAVFTPATNSWTPMAAAPASLSGRDSFAAVWTGRQMLVWGGRSGACTPCFQSDGAAYDETSDSWTPMAPSPLSGRAGTGAVWTGRDMLIWGGSDTSPQADGALYDPVTDAWAGLVAGPLTARQHHAMVWTGNQLLVWGGLGAAAKLADGAVLKPNAF